MDVINVPETPKEAFNKNRRVSDLIRAQVRHFKHLEQKLPTSQRTALPQHAIVTENDAALYIAAMTRVLCAGAGEAIEPGKKGGRVVPIRPAAVASGGLELAAAAEPKKKAGRVAKKAAKKKSKGRREGAGHEPV